jgi:DNA-binding transcriptional ArsR family regulator
MLERLAGGNRLEPAATVTEPLTTSIDKALDVCEALSGAPTGMSVADLARAMGQPRPTVHRLLTVLKRRGYVRQDEETQRYHLSLKMLDLSFRLLGRSEIRLHAYPVLREYVLRSGERTFVAIPGVGEVTYVWRLGPDDVGMRTAYGRNMPAHCSVFFDQKLVRGRLSCLRTTAPGDGLADDLQVQRLGPPGEAAVQRLMCTCAPVWDYAGREVARVGVFRHGADDQAGLGVQNRGAREVARNISMRLGHLASPTLEAASWAEPGTTTPDATVREGLVHGTD